MRGAGRPASAAAALIFGAMCDSIACSSASHRIVPSVRDPASCSITGPSAASITCMRGSSVTYIGLLIVNRSFSTSTIPGPAIAASSTSR